MSSPATAPTVVETFPAQQPQQTSPTYREAWPDIGHTYRRVIRTVCSQKYLYARIPAIGWARSYKLAYVYQDIVAGITVALTAIPQGIAYAVVAGLEPQYGLYSELVASFVYCVLGSCRNVTIGPTSIMALMVQSYVLLNADFAVLVAFIAGLIILVMGLCHLGFLVRFISQPIAIGFTTAAAFFIGSLQVKSLLGIPGRSSEFLESWIHVIENIEKTRLWDSLLGFGSIAFLLALKWIGDLRGNCSPGCVSFWRYVSLARNALIVIIGSTIAFALTTDGQPPPFALTGQIQAGFPPIGPPPFSTQVGNETIGFGAMAGTLGTSILSIPMVAILEIISVAKAFSKGKTVDATQELIVLGCCNILGSFFRSMPVTGSFTRTAVNEASGVRTPFGGIATGIVVMLSLGFLTNTFQYIPKATLAAVIIAAMINMVDFGAIGTIWRARRADIIPFGATFIGCLALSLDYGIVIGVAVNLLFVVYATARPEVVVQQLQYGDMNVVLARPDQSLFYSAAESFKYTIVKNATRQRNGDDGRSSEDGAVVVVICGKMVHSIDVTVATALLSLVEDLKMNNIRTIFWNWSEQPAGVAWRRSEQLGELFVTAKSIDDVLIKLKRD